MAIARRFYSLAIRLLTPLLLARLIWRGVQAPAYFKHWSERFGFETDFPAGGDVLWLHAVSVGEVMAARPVVERLRSRLPQAAWVITVSTPTGRERATAVFGSFALVTYLPYDFPGAMRRFLGRCRPSVAMVMETELWPNLFAQCRRRGIPLALLNVRMSKKSAAGYARLQSVSREMFDAVSWAAVQTESDAQRVVALGLSADKIAVTGSVKLDAEISPIQLQLGRDLRRVLGEARPVWIAASTREGEEPLVLEAHRRVVERIPTVGLVLVPRHPERFDEVARLAASQGYRVARRSASSQLSPGWQVFIGDTMGEMPVYYSASDVAFIGGSLVPLGGQNVLEPAAMGLPLLCGPYTFNFAQVTSELEQGGGLQRVTDGKELAEAVIRLLESENARREQGRRAQAYIEANRGAADKVAAGVLALFASRAASS